MDNIYLINTYNGYIIIKNILLLYLNSIIEWLQQEIEIHLEIIV